VAFAGDTGAHPDFGKVCQRPGALDAVPMHWGTFALMDEPHDGSPRQALRGWVSRGWDVKRLWVMAPGESLKRV